MEIYRRGLCPAVGVDIIYYLFIYLILQTIEGPCRVGNYIIFKASNTMEDVANVATNVTSNEI